MTPNLLDRVIVPIAHVADAKMTCEAIEEFLGREPVELHVVHVIEKGDGAPDKAPIEAREEDAASIFEFSKSFFRGTDVDVDTELRYGTSVVDEIVGAAEETDASAIAFVPRSGSRIVRLLSGNLTQQLVEIDRLPVLVLPSTGEEE